MNTNSNKKEKQKITTVKNASNLRTFYKRFLKI